MSKFSVFGFGGIPSFAGGTGVSHCFNLTGIPDPTIVGLHNVLKVYRETLQNIKLKGPTNFSRILEVILDYMKS